MPVVRTEILRPTRPTEIGPATAADEITCLVARSADAHVAIDVEYCSIWLALSGPVKLEFPDGMLCIPSRHFRIGLGDVPLRGSGTAGAWVVVAMPMSLVRSLGAPVLLPATLRIPRPLLRAVYRLIRGTHGDGVSTWYQRLLAQDVLDAIPGCQQALDPFVGRCPGRTDEQRRQTLQRLLRVRQLYELRRDEPLTVERMAELSHYSTSHFIRTFHDVFGESPMDFMVSVRMKHARTLLVDTALAITEISQRVGYANSAAFARVFRSYFGETASQARARIGAGRSLRRDAHRTPALVPARRAG